MSDAPDWKVRRLLAPPESAQEPIALFQPNAPTWTMLDPQRLLNPLPSCKLLILRRNLCDVALLWLYRDWPSA